MKKLLKFDKLFDYYDYLENINNKSKNEIKEISDMLNNHNISEGLIMTYPLDKSYNILKRKFTDNKISIGDDNEIFIGGEINIENLKILSNTLGYHISSMDVGLITLEPKYDMEVNIPDKIYHSTIESHLNRIKKIGLIPKSKNKLTIHPDRIYFSTSLKDAKLFAKYLSEKYDEIGYIIEISTKNIINKFYSDINFRRSGSYTLNNISPKNITNISKN